MDSIILSKIVHFSVVPRLCHWAIPGFSQQCPAGNKMLWAMGSALKKIGKFSHLIYFSPLVSLPTIRTVIREVTKTGLKQMRFMVNSFKFSDNYCIASRKLSC